MDKGLKALISILALLACAAFFFYIIDAQLPAVARFALGVGSLALFGTILIKLYKLEGWYGLILLRSKWGLDFLDTIARKHAKAFSFFADVGLVLGYGSLAFFLIDKEKRKLCKRTIAVFGAGSFLLIIFTAIIAPLATSALFSIIVGGQEFEAAGSKLKADISGPGTSILLLGILLVGGLATLVTFNVIFYAGYVLLAIGEFMLGTSTRILTTAPGGTPIIPGKNIPLVEGVAALAVVLVVHEGLHGIIARIHKLPLTSAGLVFFGFLPFGAFVDIHEKKLFTEKKPKQNAVFVAGSTANFATSVIFLVILLGFVSLISLVGIGKSGPGLLSNIFIFLALTFSLNFVVGVINLIPLPLFDGYHIMRNGVGNAKVSTAIAYILAIAFVVTMLPWILK